MMNNYKVYYNDGHHEIIEATNESEARGKAKSKRPHQLVVSVELCV